MLATHPMKIARLEGVIYTKQSPQGSLWAEVGAWVALLPTLFITMGGRLLPESAPVAFRFTAMAGGSTAAHMLTLGCSLLIASLIATRLRAILRVCLQARLFPLLPLFALVSVIWSRNPRNTVLNAIQLALATLFAVYLYVRYPGQRLVSFLTFAAIISLILCVLTVVLAPSIGIDALQQGAWRGIFGQRNNCAVICACFFAIGLQYRARSLTDNVLRVILLFLAAVFIVMSASRTGWALGVFGLALTYGLRFSRRIRSLDRIPLIMVIATPTFILAYLVATHFNETLAMMGKDPTMTQRTIIWAQVIPSIARHPFLGYGYSAFWQGLKGESMQSVLVTGWMEAQAQNGYLDVLLQLGCFGLIPLACMF